MTKQLTKHPLWTSNASGKLIITGEYSVLKGYSALGIPLAELSVKTIINPAPVLRDVTLNDQVSNEYVAVDPHAQSDVSNKWVIYFPNLGKELIYPFSGRFDIDDVEDSLQPFVSILKAIPLPPETGGSITLRSRIPRGAGLGSSAATIISFIKAIDHVRSQIFRYATPLSAGEILGLAKKAEDYCHGRSSGFDLAICYYGTGVLVDFGTNDDNKRSIRPMDVPIISNSHMIYTGIPAASTKECFYKVNNDYPTNSVIWSELGQISNLMIEAYLSQDEQKLKEHTKANHQLLCRLGIVSEKVQHFISIWQSLGGAAKVSGAGSVYGDKAGAVFAFVPSSEAGNLQVFDDLCRRYGYRANPIDTESTITKASAANAGNYNSNNTPYQDSNIGSRRGYNTRTIA
jgi:mevalonate kinase